MIFAALLVLPWIATHAETVVRTLDIGGVIAPASVSNSASSGIVYDLSCYNNGVAYSYVGITNALSISSASGTVLYVTNGVLVDAGTGRQRYSVNMPQTLLTAGQQYDLFVRSYNSNTTALLAQWVDDRLYVVSESSGSGCCVYTNVVNIYSTTIVNNVTEVYTQAVTNVISSTLGCNPATISQSQTGGVVYWDFCSATAFTNVQSAYTTGCTSNTVSLTYTGGTLFLSACLTNVGAVSITQTGQVNGITVTGQTAQGDVTIAGSGVTMTGGVINIASDAAADPSTRYVSIAWATNERTYTASAWAQVKATNNVALGATILYGTNYWDTNNWVYAPGTTGVYAVQYMHDDDIGGGNVSYIGLWRDGAIWTNHPHLLFKRIDGLYAYGSGAVAFDNDTGTWGSGNGKPSLDFTFSISNPTSTMGFAVYPAGSVKSAWQGKIQIFRLGGI